MDRLQANPIIMRIWAIPEEDLRRAIISDSAYDQSGKQKSQHGWLLAYTTPELSQGRSAKVSLMFWKSRRLRRKASSSLLCESIAGSKATSSLLWMANLDMSLRYASHRHGQPLSVLSPENPTVLTKQRRLNQDPGAQLVIDAKALFDSLLSEQQDADDDRAALEASLIKEDLDMLDARPRWVPHDKNPADALTKLDGAHVTPMLKLLRTSRFSIREELEELEEL